MESAAPKPTVFLVALWGVSHFAPMVEFGKRLLALRLSGGLAVKVLVMPSPTGEWEAEVLERIRREEASGLDIRFHNLPGVEPPADHTGIEEFVSRYVQGYVLHVKAAIVSAACPVAAVVVDLFCTTLLDAPQELGVPAYVFLISSAAMCALLLRSPSLDEEVPAGVAFDALDVPGLGAPVPGSCLPTGLDDRTIQTYRWFLYNGRRYMETHGIIINTVAEVEASVLAAINKGRCTRGFPTPAVYTIGPVVAIAPPTHGGDKHECVRWLDAQPTASVLFLCFGGGSGGSFTVPQVHEIAQGLERSGHRFLWVLRGQPEPGSKLPTDANLGELLPAKFLERTKGRGLVWPARAPQKEILAHSAVGGFATHCGWNSILESLWFGVPMLPWPHAAEQHFNAFALVAAMGVAVPMEIDKTRDNFVRAAELERAVKALMDDGETAKKIRDKIVEMKASCRKAVEKDGSSVVSLQRLYHALIQDAVEAEPKK